MSKARSALRAQDYIFSLLAGVICFFTALMLSSLFFKQRVADFSTLQEVAYYAHVMPEHPPLSNTNIARPDYRLYHRSRVQGFFKRIRNGIQHIFAGSGIALWSERTFTSLLQQVYEDASQRGMNGNIICRMSPQPGERYVVWGDMQGAYHSLVRGLVRLYSLGILGEDLQLRDEKTTIVFMGDAISRSAYGMEILSLMLALLKKNPGKVVYLRGNHEDKKYWHPFGLKDQLLIRLGEEKGKDAVKRVDALFKMLPLALYCKIHSENNDFVRLSHLGWQRSKVLHEKWYEKFLIAQQGGRIDYHHIEKKENAAEHGIEVSGVIRSEKKRDTFQSMDGIRLLPAERGATSWTLLSSPTTVTQKGLKFFHDAFSIISVSEKKEAWTITLHNQDATKLDGFSVRSYGFFSGQLL